MLLLLSADFFSKLTFSKILFHEHYQSVSCLDPDQDGHSVSPEIGPNRLQMVRVDL